MVKTNQFVRVSSIDIDLARLILSSGLPIVTMDRAAAERFQGCIMEIDLSVVPGDWVDEPWDGEGDWNDDFDENWHKRPAGTGPRFNLLILGRHWDSFCRMLSEGTASFQGFERNVRIELKMNAYPEEIPDFKAPISHYFTVERQATLLGGMSNVLRNFENVVIGGTIDKKLAESTVQAIAARQWTSTEGVIRDLSARKEKAKKASSQDSLKLYMETVMLMRRIYGSADFPRLVDEGDVAFVSSFAKLYFTTLLDACQPILETVRDADLVLILAWSNVIYEHVSLAQEALEDFAAEGSNYEPSSAVMAQLAYIIAATSRLLGQASPRNDTTSISQYRSQAVNTIATAVRLHPTDAVILAESDRIREWNRNEYRN